MRFEGCVYHANVDPRCVRRQHLLKRFAGACQLGKLALLLHLCQFLLHGHLSFDRELSGRGVCLRGGCWCGQEFQRRGRGGTTSLVVANVRTRCRCVLR